MRLEPVYLVAPKPRPPSMPTRRALLGMGLAFAVGGAIGSACGYSVGSARAGDKATDAPSGASGEDYPLSGNADLDELRRLAVKAPIEELMGARMSFLSAIGADFRTDPVLWRGIRRMTDHLLAGGPAGRRQQLCRAIVQVIETAEPEMRAAFVADLPRLKAQK